MRTWKELSSTYLAVAEEEAPVLRRSIWWRLGAAAALPGLLLIGCGGDLSLAASAVSGDEDGDGVDDTATATATGSQTATATATDAGTNTEDSLDTTGGTDDGDDTTGLLKSPV